MKIPLKTIVNLVLLVGLLTLQYQNCSSYHDPSPFAGGNLATASNSSPSDIRLDSPNGVIDIGTVEQAISFGGECNIGFSKKHYIEIQISDANNTPISVREDSLCPRNGTGLAQDCFRATQFRCEHGRYYIHLPLNCGYYRNQPQSFYRLVGQLVIVDETTGQEFRDNKAAFDRFFNISWPAGSCLN